MDKVSAQTSTLRNIGTEVVSRGPSQRPTAGVGNENLFRDQLSALTQSPAQALKPEANGGASALKFSNHAVDRMRSRGVHFSPDEMTRIQGAVSKAASKGSKDTLLITDKAALIVSVKDNTVVTVMDKASLKENVFTNIDSTVVV